MQHKKIDITQAILSNVEEAAAKAFIDSRQGGRTKFTQRAFDRALNAAIRCENQGICSGTEAFDLTLEKGWLGVTPEYISNELARRKAAEFESAIALPNQQSHRSTRETPIANDLLDRSWAH